MRSFSRLNFRKLISGVCGIGLLLFVFLIAASIGGKPPLGYAYVLDSADLHSKTKVFVVDVTSRRVVRTLDANYVPDMALSPSGDRLYLASSINESGRLDIYDTASGQLIQTVNNPERYMATAPWYRSQMIFSGDGKWLYIFKYDKRQDLYYIDIFDAAESRFSGWRIPLPKCVTGIMSPSRDSGRLTVMCAYTNDLRFFEVSDQGQPTQISSLPLRLRGRTNRFGQEVALASFVATAGGTKTIMSDGSLFDIDTNSRTIKGLGAIDNAARRIGPFKSPPLTMDDNDWMAGRWLPFGAFAVDTTNNKTYLGIGELARHGEWTFDTIGVFDSDSLNKRSAIKTKHRLYSIALSRDGSRLFGVDRISKSLIVFDVTSGAEVAVVDNLGETPIQVLVGP